jgi:hypothetical protein
MTVEHQSNGYAGRTENKSNPHVIVRRKVAKNFTVLDNALILDQRLSWKALGLLTYLLSLPPNFRLYLSFLGKLRPTKRDATRTGLRELEDAGYLSITVERDPSGRFLSTAWYVSDLPMGPATPQEQPCTENPNTANVKAEKPKTGNTTLTRTKIQKERISITTTQEDAPSAGLQYPKVDEAQQKQLAVLIGQIPKSLQQDVLDELEGKRQRGKLRSTVVVLAQYFVKNIDKFALVDGLILRQQRTTVSFVEQTDANIKATNRALQDEVDSNLIKMTDQQFSTSIAELPPTVRKNVTKRRENLRRLLQP